MEYKKIAYVIKNSIFPLESVPEVGVVQCVYTTFLNNPGIQGEDIVSKQLSKGILHNCSFKG